MKPTLIWLFDQMEEVTISRRDLPQKTNPKNAGTEYPVSKPLAKAKGAEAIRVTFDRRGTHAVPNLLPQPPKDWQKPYDTLVKECGLSGAIDSAFTILDVYLSEGGIVETKLRES